MSNKQVSLDALKMHLFGALEGVKNLSDPEASENEKTTVEQAKVIADLAGKVIDIYKVQVDAVKTIAGLDNIGSVRSMATGLGIADNDTVKEIEAGG